MKKIILICLLLIATKSYGKSLFDYPMTPKWTTSEIILQCTYVALTIIDLMQTYSYLQKPGVEEINPIVGKHPTKEKLLFVGISGMIIHTGLVHISPKPIRFGIQTLPIGLEIFAISHNYYIGAKIKF